MTRNSSHVEGDNSPVDTVLHTSAPPGYHRDHPQSQSLRTPRKVKSYTRPAFARGDRKSRKEGLLDIQEVVINEVMSATIYDVPDLVINNFPDRLFEQSGDDIRLVDDPSQTTNVDTSFPKGNAASGRSVSQEPPPSAQTHPCPTSESNEPPASSPDDAALILKIFEFLKTKPNPLYDEKTGEWTEWPATSKADKEEQVAEYLNKIVAAAREYLDGVKPMDSDNDWVFSSKYKNRSVKSYGPERKPDIVLIPRSEHKVEKAGGWSNIRSVGEIKSKKPSKRELLGQLAQSMRLCFRYQWARRFVLGFSLIDKKMSLWKFDRSGVLVSEEFDVHKNPIDFLRVILGLVLGHDFYVGLDPSFTQKEGKDFVELDGKTYEILKEMRTDSVIRGRGTVVFLVKDENGHEYAMKEQWVDRSRKIKEYEILEKLKETNVKNVPRLVAHQLVHFQVGDEIVKDSTANDRVSPHAEKQVKDKGIETRDHYRILMSPFGEKLESFRSKKELVSAFKDLVKVIKDIREEGVEVVHRDISPRNVILVQEPGLPFRTGYLIDFDCAVEVNHAGKALAELTGTLPYMALDILQEEACNHEYYHDLESLFYVLIWICLTQDGPDNKPRNMELNHLPLYHWYRGDVEDKIQMDGVAFKKGYHMGPGFDKLIINNLPEYFKKSETMLVFLKGIREIIFRETPKISTSDKDREILEREKSMKDRKKSKAVLDFLEDVRGIIFRKMSRARDDDQVIPDRKKSMRDRKTNGVVSEIFEVCDAAISRFENEPSPLDSQTLPRLAADNKGAGSATGSEESDRGPVTPEGLDLAQMRRVKLIAQEPEDDGVPKAGGVSELHRLAMRNSQAGVGRKRSHHDEEDIVDVCLPSCHSHSSSSSKRFKSGDH